VKECQDGWRVVPLPLWVVDQAEDGGGVLVKDTAVGEVWMWLGFCWEAAKVEDEEMSWEDW
jgi:hypothetical protein